MLIICSAYCTVNLGRMPTLRHRRQASHKDNATNAGARQEQRQSELVHLATTSAVGSSAWLPSALIRTGL